jgi:hypothetical protein
VDQVGFAETSFFANEKELEQFRMTVIQSLFELRNQQPAADRRMRKLAIITHPISGKEIEK